VTSRNLRLLPTLAILLLAMAGAATGSEPAAAAPAPSPEASTPNPTDTSAAPASTAPLSRHEPALKLSPTDSNSRNFVWQSLSAILVIIVLGGIALIVVKRWGSRISQARGKKMRLMETFHLGQQKTLILMEVGNQRLLLGVSRDGLRLVADVSAAIPPSEGSGETEAKFVIPSPDAPSPDAKSGGKVTP
jgi:flagellar biogenesis protein FliO